MVAQQVNSEELKDKHLYKIDGAIIKISLPAKWEETGSGPAMLRFKHSDEEPDSMAILSITIFPKNDFYKEPYSEELLKEVGAAAKKDPSYKVISEEIISFAGTKALDLVTETAFETPIKLKIKSITFIKGSRQFQIQFTAEKEKFDILLLAINESLKTFEVMSQNSDLTKLVTKAVSSNYSLDLRNKFKSMLENMYLEIIATAKENKDVWILNEIPGVSIQEKSQNAASEVLSKYKGAVEISESDAEAILRGSFDDNKNLSDIKDCVAKFRETRKPIPVIIQYLLNKYQSHASSSLELELTARIFKEYLRQAAL